MIFQCPNDCEFRCKMNIDLVKNCTLQYNYDNNVKDYEKIRINLSVYLGCMSHPSQKYLWDCFFTKSGVYNYFSPRHFLYYLLMYGLINHEKQIIYSSKVINIVNYMLILEYNQQIRDNGIYDPYLLVRSLYDSDEDKTLFHTPMFFKFLNKHFKDCLKIGIMKKKKGMYLNFLQKAHNESNKVLQYPDSYFPDEQLNPQIILILIDKELQRLFR